MKKLLWLAMLAALGGSPAMANLLVIADGQITMDLIPDASASPGSDFHWQFSVYNETGYYLYPNGFDTDFLPGSVTGDTTDFDAAYLNTDGIAPGETSSAYQIGYYTIPGASSGVFGPGTVIVYFQLFRPDDSDYVFGEIDFEDQTVSVTGELPATPEPGPGVLCLGGLAVMAGWKRWSDRKCAGSRQAAG
jgi:hypothetical protein